MKDIEPEKSELAALGFTTITNVFSDEEILQMVNTIEAVDTSRPTFRKSNDLFAIRRFLKEIPEIEKIIFNGQLKEIITQLFGSNYFVIKSIYFDKPESSNWFVAYHQDLTISVDKKAELEGYGPWTVKQDQFAVQPPIEILQNIFTIRIHLDDTDENNGALKVIPGSHIKGIYRPETIDWNKETEHTCPVPLGGIMIMKPLLLHSSGRSTSNRKRRVIHIEMTDVELGGGLRWGEK